MKQAVDRPIRIGMHTYTLHFFGFGESWGFGKDYFFDQVMSLYELMDKCVEWELDGLQITKVDLLTTAQDDPFSTENLHKVAAYAKKCGLFLEFNSSFNAGSDSRVNCTVEEALRIGHDLDAELVKFSLDIIRPKNLFGSEMHPDVVKQILVRYDEFKAAIPLIEEYGMQIAIENHTDTKADEIVWLVDKLNHTLIGTCVDNMNAYYVTDDPEQAYEKMLPSAYCCHFSDDLIYTDPLGVHIVGAAHGQGSMDCKRMIDMIREKSPMDKIIMENEIAFLSKDEPIEEARAREMKACEESIRYLREELNLGVRNR